MSELSIVTTQNVKINFTIASVGDRILGQILDLIFIIAYIYFADLLIDSLGLKAKFIDMDNWSVGAIYILFYFPVIFYTIVQESVWEGQTFGKRIIKIKVIKIDGYQASFGDYLARWLFRLVEVISFPFTLIGLFSIIFSKQNQRLGDMVAGTAVISLRNKININHTILQEINEDYVPVYPMVIKLSDNDVRIIKETFETAVLNRDYATLIKLREKIIEVTGVKNQSGNDQDFIRTIMKDYNFYTQNM